MVSPRPRRGRALLYGSTGAPTRGLQTTHLRSGPRRASAIAEIYNAKDPGHALTAAEAFADLYGAKWPKTVAKITDDLDVLLACFDYPAEHGIATSFQPMESAQTRWASRERTPPRRPGSRRARFDKGILVERPDESGGDQQVA